MKLAAIILLIASFLVLGTPLLAEEVHTQGTEIHDGRSDGDTRFDCVGDEVEIKKDRQIGESSEECPDGKDMLTVQNQPAEAAGAETGTSRISTASLQFGTGVVALIVLLIIIL
ncbi:MAG: hypothetical protein M0P70_04960 [Desulfobulbaceae bacterium]|nr:hypothetical protein [Desulfobulbaceae bacterium]